MKKTKMKAKKKALRFLVFGVGCVVICGTILISLTKVWINIYSKYKEQEELNKLLILLKEEEQKLSLDVDRLQDPEYVARYLREKYLYSKDNEYIIRIPDEEK